MSEDTPQLTEELAAAGVVPSQPVISTAAALRHLKPQRRGHLKPSQQRRTRTRWGQIKPSGRGLFSDLALIS